MSKKANYLAIIFLSTVYTPTILFLFRYIDNNRIVRWSWAFEGVSTLRILFLLIPCIILGVVLAYGLSRLSFFERYPSIFLFTTSFVSAALFWSEPEFSMDASRYFIQAKHLELYGISYFFNEWGRDIVAWTDLPLIPFLYGLIFKFLGEHRIFIEMFTTLLFSLSVVLTYMIGKRLWDEKTGLHAGLLLLGIPYLFTQAPLMMVDIPTMFFLTLSIFAFLMVMDKGGIKATAFSSIAVFLCLFSKYSTWPMLSILVIILLVYMKKDPRTAIYRGGMVAVIAGMLTALVIALKYDLISEQFKLLISYQMSRLEGWDETFISIFLFQIHPLITALAIYSIYAAFKQKDIKYVIAGYLPVLIFIFQIKLIRYIIPLFPMLTLMASYGLKEIRDIHVRRFIVFCIITFSLVLAGGVFLPFLQRYSLVNLKDAGQFLRTLDTRTIEVFTLPQGRSDVNPAAAVPILDLFTDKNISYNYEMNRNFGPLPPEKRIIKSPVRFSWEYKNPRFYTRTINGSREDTVVVIISNRPYQILPEYVRQRIKGMRKLRVFKTSATGMYKKYKAIVTIYN